MANSTGVWIDGGKASGNTSRRDGTELSNGVEPAPHKWAWNTQTLLYLYQVNKPQDCDHGESNPNLGGVKQNYRVISVFILRI